MANIEIPGPSDTGTSKCRMWSLCNPIGEHARDLPLLLRRVADQMEHDGIEPMDILAVTVDQEINEDGPWWNVQVFWAPDDAED